MHGSVNIDDAVFFFGKENDWKVKVGRFEAYDMFPLNQDTFVEHSGNTANDLYDDGSGYIYMMKGAAGVLTLAVISSSANNSITGILN